MSAPCKGCGAPFRKGKRVGVLGENGDITVAVICSGCAKRAMRVVRPIGSAACLCTVCKTTPARICSGCAATARQELVMPVLAALAGLAKAARLSGQRDRADGLENAAYALEAEAGRG